MPRWDVIDPKYGRVQVDEEGRYRRPRQPYYAYIWPMGGKRRSGMGRLSDIIHGKGPDIFVATNPNRPVTAADGPTRNRWINAHDQENNERFKESDFFNYRGRWRAPDRPKWEGYDFRYRKYMPKGPGWIMDSWNSPYSGRTLVWRELKPDLKKPWIYHYPAGQKPPRDAVDPRNFDTYMGRGACGIDNGMFWHPAIDPPFFNPAGLDAQDEFEWNDL